MGLSATRGRDLKTLAYSASSSKSLSWGVEAPDRPPDGREDLRGVSNWFTGNEVRGPRRRGRDCASCVGSGGIRDIDLRVRSARV